MGVQAQRVSEMRLRIKVDDQNFLLKHRESDGNIESTGRFTDAPFWLQKAMMSGLLILYSPDIDFRQSSKKNL